MNSIQVITFVAIALSMSFVKCDPPKPNVDAKCLVPPPNDVDPMQCCKIPELLDTKLIETCATKVYGPESNPSNNQNEPPFAPHIRVSLIYKSRVRRFYISWNSGINWNKCFESIETLAFFQVFFLLFRNYVLIGGFPRNCRVGFPSAYFRLLILKDDFSKAEITQKLSSFLVRHRVHTQWNWYNEGSNVPANGCIWYSKEGSRSKIRLDTNCRRSFENMQRTW